MTKDELKAMAEQVIELDKLEGIQVNSGIFKSRSNDPVITPVVAKKLLAALKVIEVAKEVGAINEIYYADSPETCDAIEKMMSAIIEFEC